MLWYGIWTSLCFYKPARFEIICHMMPVREKNDEIRSDSDESYGKHAELSIFKPLMYEIPRTSVPDCPTHLEVLECILQDIQGSPSPYDVHPSYLALSRIHLQRWNDQMHTDSFTISVLRPTFDLSSRRCRWWPGPTAQCAHCAHRRHGCLAEKTRDRIRSRQSVFLIKPDQICRKT
jgi:hypothetical protein